MPEENQHNIQEESSHMPEDTQHDSMEESSQVCWEEYDARVLEESSLVLEV